MTATAETKLVEAPLSSTEKPVEYLLGLLKNRPIVSFTDGIRDILLCDNRHFGGEDNETSRNTLHIHAWRREVGDHTTPAESYKITKEKITLYIGPRHVFPSDLGFKIPLWVPLAADKDAKGETRVLQNWDPSYRATLVGLATAI